MVVLLVGNRDQHLDVLREVASRLRDPVLYERLVSAKTAAEAYDLLTHPVTREQQGIVYEDQELSRLTFAHAMGIAREFNRARLVVHADAVPDADYVHELVAGSGALIVSGIQNKFPPAHENDMDIVEIPFRGLRRSTQVHFALLFLLSQRHIEREDLVVNVFGRPASGFFDSIRLTHIRNEFDLPISFQQTQIGRDVDRHVLTRVLQLAGEPAVEGREGKAVGALFAVGDVPPNELHPGLGARHAAALAITERTNALSVVISESTRRISVFHAGRRIIFT